jgi:hypothetical protein
MGEAGHTQASLLQMALSSLQSSLEAAAAADHGGGQALPTPGGGTSGGCVAWALVCVGRKKPGVGYPQRKNDSTGVMFLA